MIDYKKIENLKFKTCYSKRTLSKSKVHSQTGRSYYNFKNLKNGFSYNIISLKIL